MTDEELKKRGTIMANAKMETRRKFIKESVILAGSSFILPQHVFHIAKRPKLSKQLIGHGDFKYRADLSWGILNPSETPVNDCHEMVQDSSGRIILLTNETRNNIIMYDRSGKLLKTWGHDFVGAHGLTLVDEGGEEMLYITDTASHAVYKTTLEGKQVLKLSFPQELETQFSSEKYYPTETAIAPNGDIYVADGYGTQCILRYDAQGRFIQFFGGMGWMWKELLEKRYPDNIQWENKPDHQDPSLLNNAHGITLDTRKKQPELLVTSRMDNMIKRFTLEGEHISDIEIPGAFVCRAVVDEQNIYAAVLRSDRPSRDETGFVTILNQENKVVSNPGGSQPIYQDGQLRQVQQLEKLFKHPHDVCIDQDKNLYIPQWNANKVYPIRLVRV